MAISFENDIKPFFAQYQAQMGWRFDLTDYENVKANAEMIKTRIDPSPKNQSRMPPPPFPAFSQDLYDNFCKWIDAECPR